MPRIRALVAKESEYRDNLVRRDLASLVEKFDEGLKIDGELRTKKLQLDQCRADQNRISKEFEKSRDQTLIQESRRMGEQIRHLEEETRQLEGQLLQVEVCLPNWQADDIPPGAGDEAEKPLWYKGTACVAKEHVDQATSLYPGATFEPLATTPFHHYELVGRYVDQDTGGKVAQTRFYYELDELAILDMALGMYATEFFLSRGYDHKFMIPPYMMRRSIEERATYFEAFQDTIFQVADEGMILIPSSEHSILAYYEDQIIPEADLPLRVTAWSPCFRKEAGAHGKDTRGIFRVKQFNKVEMHSIVGEGEDQAEVERYANDISDFMSSLELPHRAVMVPAVDMDKRAIRQVDIQGWMPGQGRYRETHSIATIGTWASEKLAIRYRKANKKNELVRNVYATGVAVQRMICVIAENHYHPESKMIVIPEKLRKYTMGRNELKLS